MLVTAGHHPLSITFITFLLVPPFAVASPPYLIQVDNTTIPPICVRYGWGWGRLGIIQGLNRHLLSRLLDAVVADTPILRQAYDARVRFAGSRQRGSRKRGNPNQLAAIKCLTPCHLPPRTPGTPLTAGLPASSMWAAGRSQRRELLPPSLVPRGAGVIAWYVCG